MVAEATDVPCLMGVDFESVADIMTCMAGSFFRHYFCKIPYISPRHTKRRKNIILKVKKSFLYSQRVYFFDEEEGINSDLNYSALTLFRITSRSRSRE